MDVPIQHSARPQRPIYRLELLIIGVGHRRAPQLPGAGMHDCDVLDAQFDRQLPQPREPLLTDPFARIRGVRLEQPSQQRPQTRRAIALALLLFGAPQQLVGVAEHSLPAELADAIDHLGRSGPHQH